MLVVLSLIPIYFYFYILFGLKQFRIVHCYWMHQKKKKKRQLALTNFVLYELLKASISCNVIIACLYCGWYFTYVCSAFKMVLSWTPARRYLEATKTILIYFYSPSFFGPNMLMSVPNQKSRYLPLKYNIGVHRNFSRGRFFKGQIFWGFSIFAWS